MMLYLFMWLVEDKHQPRRAALFLPNTCNGEKNRGSLSKHLHLPLAYSEFLKRNDDALLIRVVGGGQTPTSACYFILSNTCNGGNKKTKAAIGFTISYELL
jgi:hypothetical protein